MSARPLMFTVIGLSFVAGWAASPPRTTKYKVETRVEQILDLTALGQSEQRNNLGMVNFLTITLDDTVGGKTVHAVLDSIVQSDSTPLPDPSIIANSRGRTWHGHLSPDGKLTNVKRVDSAGAGGGDLISNFFPRVKAGAKVGDQWTDTTETTSDDDGQSLTTRTVTNYSITGTETRNGQRALKVASAFSVSQTGEVLQGGQSLSIEGTGSGTGTHYVTQDGSYLGGTSLTNANLTVTADQLPAPIPIQVKNTVTVTTIP